jgi:hypothetical protein
VTAVAALRDPPAVPGLELLDRGVQPVYHLTRWARTGVETSRQRHEARIIRLQDAHVMTALEWPQMQQAGLEESRAVRIKLKRRYALLRPPRGEG